MFTKFRKLSLFAMCFCMTALSANTALAQFIIREIRVDGAERIEPATVVSYLNLSVGDQMTQRSLDGALKQLFSTGLFADVTLRQDGHALVVEVAENPIINQIAFEGNDAIKDEELEGEVQLRPRQVFTRTRVQADVSRIYQLYRRNGRFSVTIEPKIIRLDQNRVNLVFEVDEGAVTTVESINFIGNEVYDDDRLRSEISTKEDRWFRFLSSDDRYDKDRVAYDQEILRRFYLSQGYADYQLLSSSAELSEKRDSFYLTFTIDEGERYKVGNVGVNSRIPNFDTSKLEPEIMLEAEEWYNAELMQESVDNITDVLGDNQYAFVEVAPQVKRNPDSKTVDITFTVNEAPRVYVERIDIDGNVRTLDKVVRREMLLVEGDPYNKSKLARSEQNIKNLNYFETVEVSSKPGSAPDKSVVDIKVAEKSTGELSIGAGFSTNDGPLADFRIRERNLLGKGQDLLFSTVVSGERTEFDLSFTEPYFLNRDLSAGFDVFHMTRDLQDESSYDQERSGGSLRVGYPLSERWRQTLKYTLENNAIENVNTTASRFIRDQEGERTTSAVSQRTTYDNRDSVIFPREGLLYWLDTEIAGLGGDAEYISGKTGASYYYPVWEDVIFNVLGEVGAIEGYNDKDVIINERYYLGGSTLRGFANAGVGPRDSATDDALGGNFFYRSSAELSFPVGLPEELGVQGHTFADAGSLTDVDEAGAGILDAGSLRASVGAGLSWRSPFGPIRVDLAIPVASEDYDEEEKFRFNFGTRF